MQSIVVEGQTGRSEIMVGEHLANLSNHLPPGRTILITDENVARYYQDQFPACDVITIGCGEKIKTLTTIEKIYHRFIELEADRTTFIVGIGGGIVGDITGFAASTYMRGLDFGFVATSLLAQVDATVGGKNGVNFSGFKNMVGVFNQPRFVIADINMLRTLPPEEVANGLAEIVKHACIIDGDYFDEIEAKSDAIGELDLDVMHKLVYDSVVIKANVTRMKERPGSGANSISATPSATPWKRRWVSPTARPSASGWCWQLSFPCKRGCSARVRQSASKPCSAV